MVAVLAFAAIPHPEIDTLVAGAAAGDVACFDALYRRDAERVYNLVLRSCGDADEAQDVCQEVWSRAHRSLGSLRDAGAFDAWVMRIAARACIDASRRRHVEYDETTLMTLEGGRDASEEVERQEQRHLAWQALGALPQRQRVALYLREVDGMRYADIAETIGATPGRGRDAAVPRAALARPGLRTPRRLAGRALSARTPPHGRRPGRRGRRGRAALAQGAPRRLPRLPAPDVHAQPWQARLRGVALRCCLGRSGAGAAARGGRGSWRCRRTARSRASRRAAIQDDHGHSCPHRSRSDPDRRWHRGRAAAARPCDRPRRH